MCFFGSGIDFETYTTLFPPFLLSLVNVFFSYNKMCLGFYIFNYDKIKVLIINEPVDRFNIVFYINLAVCWNQHISHNVYPIMYMWCIYLKNKKEYKEKRTVELCKKKVHTNKSCILTPSG